MMLAPGTKLGPYEILAFIGAGGMGRLRYHALLHKMNLEGAQREAY